MNELIAIIKTNFENVNGDFQSIYDHHEILISQLVDLAQTAGLTLNSSSLTTDLVSTPVPQPLFPPLADLSKDALYMTLKTLYASFTYYHSYELEKKTTNHHNCRKSALLSQLLLISKGLQRLCIAGAPG